MSGKKQEKAKLILAEEKQQKEINDILSRIAETQQAFAEELKNLKDEIYDIKTGGKDRFKKEAVKKDIETAKATRENIDFRITEIVDEVLGEDFGIEIVPEKDKPGFLFSILVPQRLSPVKTAQRPVVDPSTGEYKRAKDGGLILEEYWPGDKRSRMLSNIQSYDAIREHCERIRANIVAWHQKLMRPMPEFRLKQYGE